MEGELGSGQHSGNFLPSTVTAESSAANFPEISHKCSFPESYLGLWSGQFLTKQITR